MTPSEIEQRFGNQEERIARLENGLIQLTETQQQLSAMQRIFYEILGGQDRIIQRQEEVIQRQEEAIAELRSSNARQDQVIAELRVSNEQFRRRHEEADQRFNILLEEVRFLTRQQQSEN